MRKREPVPQRPIEWQRAEPKALAAFDPRTRQCTMNCGPAAGDPRSSAERKLLCDECLAVCPICRGKGYTDEGDPEIGSAIFGCERCGCTGLAPVTGVASGDGSER